MGLATLTSLLFCSLLTGAAVASDLRGKIEQQTNEINGRVIEWRRHLHANPELGNREFQTAKFVADHLRGLGLEVETEIAHTGIVALRADMDALPVTEQVDLPFASKIRTEYNGQEVGVMHACGHDNHVAILMGVAEVLSSLKDELPGTVKFLLQPAEEGAPAGEEGGAELMLREGAFNEPRPDAVFGLHVFPGPVGTLFYRSGGMLAAADQLRIVIEGRQTHAAWPWA
jgi:amidohydrolase